MPTLLLALDIMKEKDRYAVFLGIFYCARGDRPEILFDVASVLGYYYHCPNQFLLRLFNKKKAWRNRWGELN